ncbi:ABC transporter ATP-binding protein [Candidatus Pacebacteria bacterium]|nr:ABC transporter ATP-binding protein [Candidatus Paceibacterota bacterium]
MIEAKDIKRTFVNGKVETPVLKGIDVSIKEGEFVAIMGRSGAGKSTLLYQLSLLDQPSSGKIKIGKKDMLKLSQTEKTKYRLKNMGFIFQDYALIPELTATENVMMPLLMQGYNTGYAKKKSQEKLASLGLKKQFDNLPSQLSGGEQQRVSIARAIVHDPKIIFADEPTANLDLSSAKNIIEILEDLRSQGKHTIVMVTHEKDYGKRTDRIIWLEDGMLEKEEKNKKIKKTKKKLKKN